MIQMQHQKIMNADSKKSEKRRSKGDTNAAPKNSKRGFKQNTMQWHNDMHSIIPGRS